MADVKNPYRRRIDPEHDGLFVGVIATALLLLLLVCGLLYATTRSASYEYRIMQPTASR
jgi:succinate dehydrogenase hydrophobic anchor subunit